MYGLLVCGRMPTYKFNTSSFMSLTVSSYMWELVTGTVSIPYSMYRCSVYFPLTCGGTLLSHRTPDIFLQLFHLNITNARSGNRTQNAGMPSKRANHCTTAPQGYSYNWSVITHHIISLILSICVLGAIQVLQYVTLFVWILDPHPPPSNANKVEPYTFVTLFPGKVDTPPPPSALRNTWMAP